MMGSGSFPTHSACLVLAVAPALKISVVWSVALLSTLPVVCRPAVLMPACKPLQCQVCGHLSGVVRGARQLTAGGAATASGPAALSLADNAVFALNALFHALHKDCCMSGHPQNPFTQGGLARQRCVIIPPEDML